MNPNEMLVPPAAGVRLTVVLEARDIQALWSAAAAEALRAPGMTVDDVIDTIGPREDPSLEDCVLMLAGRWTVPGCSFEAIAAEELAPRPQPLTITRVAPPSPEAPVIASHDPSNWEGGVPRTW